MGLVFTARRMRSDIDDQSRDRRGQIPQHLWSGVTFILEFIRGIGAVLELPVPLVGPAPPPIDSPAPPKGVEFEHLGGRK